MAGGPKDKATFMHHISEENIHIFYLKIYFLIYSNPQEWGVKLYFKTGKFFNWEKLISTHAPFPLYFASHCNIFSSFFGNSSLHFIFNLKEIDLLYLSNDFLSITADIKVSNSVTEPT